MWDHFSTKSVKPKKSISLLVMFSLVTVMLSQTVYSQGSGVTTGLGTGWSDENQGLRFSIYDMEAYTTVSTMDILYYDNSGDNPYVEYGDSANVIRAKGCKYAYLYEYAEKGYDKYEIKNLPLYGVNVSKSGNNMTDISESGSGVYRGVFPSTEMGNIALNSADCMMPIKTQGSGGTFTWHTDIASITQIKEKIIEPGFKIGDFDRGILNKLGFFVGTNSGDETLQHFNANYILVIEPILWARMFYTLGGTNYIFSFYGTPTEFSILDAKLLDVTNFVSYRYTKNGEPKTYRSIHKGYGTITLGASVNAVIPTQPDYNLPFDINIFNYKKEFPNMDCPSDYCKNYYWKNPYGLSADDLDLQADDVVLRCFAVTTISLKNFSINSKLVTDQAYHTGTTGILSFKLESGGRAFEPDIGKLLANSDAYGLKLELKTTPDSEVKSSLLPTEIYSYGMPEGKVITEGDNQMILPVETYAFTEFKVPDTTGIWRFELQIFDTYDNPIMITSDDNVVNPETGGCIYEVKIEKTLIENPPNYTSDDKMPKDTESRSLQELESSLPQKRDALTWWYYIARPSYDGGGTPFVEMTRVDKTADCYIADSYAPMSHENIPIRYKNGQLLTRSGYGIGAEVAFVDEVIDGEITGFQSGVMLFPEYGYGSYGEPLERTGDVFNLAENEHSMYYDDAKHSDYSRVHFTPVWYPDGEYEIVVFLFDCWTPAGQAWDMKSYRVTISGTVYDDWYITRR